MAQAVQRAAEAILVSYSLKHQLTCEGVLQIISDIRQQASASPSAHHGTLRVQEVQSCQLQYLLPTEPLLQGQPADNQQLLAATRDVLGSGDFSSVLEGALDQAFAQLGCSLTEAYHSAAQSSLTLPLARIIPLITDHAPVIFTTEQHKSIAMVTTLYIIDTMDPVPSIVGRGSSLYQSHPDWSPFSLLTGAAIRN